LRQQLLEASMKEADITARFGSSHQVAIRARDEVAQVRRSLASELQRIAETFKSDYEIAKARQASLEKSLADLIRAQGTTNQARAQLRELESAAQTYTALFESTLKRQTEMSQQQSFPVSEARVVTRATPPLRKSHPQTVLIMAYALAGGGLVGLGLALIWESLDPLFRTPDSLESFTGLRCIATVPRMRSASHKGLSAPSLPARRNLLCPGPLSHVIAAPFSAFAEGIRSMKVAIDLAQEGKGPLIVGVTSSVPNEGKTTLAANLAQLIACSGRTCMLIDADLRNPSLSQAAAPDAAVGLVEVLAHSTSPEVVLRTVCDGKLAFIPSGHAGQSLDTSSLLSSSRMSLLLESEAARFDYVIIDLPPMAPLIDVRAISPHIDKLLIAVEWASTDREALRQALERNGPMDDGQILGLILNKVPLRVLKRFPTYRSDTYLRGA
jgi:polysaccharide biosynthesis transport protein